VLLADGQFEEAAAVALVGLEEAVRRGAAAADGALLAINAAEALTRLGRLAEADRTVQDALEKRPPEAIANVLRLASAEVDVLRGDMASADVALRQIIEGRTLDDYEFQAQLRAVEAELQLWDPAGQHCVVMHDLRTGLGSALTNLPGEEDVPLEARLVWLAVRADADASVHARLRGDEPALKALVDDVGLLVSRADQLATAELSDGARRQVETFRALTTAEAARIGGADRSEPWLQAAGASTAEVYLRAYALWRLAAALRGGRRRRDAGRALRQAFHLAREAEIQVLVDAIRAAGVSLGVRVDEALPRQKSALASARPYNLTAKELEVLQLLVAGQTNRRIATALSMSEKTASVHVSRILAKLSVRSRGEAVARAYETGLARPDTISTGG
jgi:DNA-binding CsgD family transcriptional regulator